MADETFHPGNDQPDTPRADEREAEPEQTRASDAAAGAEPGGARVDEATEGDGEGDGEGDAAGVDGTSLVSDPYAAPEGAAGEMSGDPLAAAPDPYEGAVPPGYDWPTHGGYLGCLLGLMAACILGGFLGSLVVGLVSVSPLGMIVSVPAVRIILILGIFVATLFALGRTGWVLGRRFYREYARPSSQSGGTADVARGQNASADRETSQRL